MKWREDQRFDCETYLETLAMGIHSPVAEEHVNSCPFCHGIYHGGTEEFPLSLKEAAEKMREEKKRKARRKFLARVGIAAACVGLVGLGYTASEFAESRKADPVLTNHRAAMARLDSLWTSKGVPGIAARLARASDSHAVEILEWIGDRGHVALYPLVVDSLADSRARASHAAYGVLLRMDRATIDGLAPHIRQVQPQMKESWMIPMIDDLLDQ